MIQVVSGYLISIMCNMHKFIWANCVTRLDLVSKAIHVMVCPDINYVLQHFTNHQIDARSFLGATPTIEHLE